MRTYELVGSVYGLFSTKNKFTEEEVVKIPNISFKSLADIDKVTAKYSVADFKKILPPVYQHKNLFSIRVLEDGHTVCFEKAIFDDKEMALIAESVKKETINFNNKKRTVNLITLHNAFYLKNLDSLEKIILDKDMAKINKIYNEKYYFNFIARRCINFDTLEDSCEFQDLRTFFADYEVFRSYVMKKDKKLYNNISLHNKKSYDKPFKLRKENSNVGSKIIASTYDEDEDDDDYDKEEFLDLEEIESMSENDATILNKKGIVPIK